MSSSATYRFSAPGCRLCVGFGPHAAERAAQPGGELFALLADRPGRHAVGQVEPGEPAGAVAHRRVDRHDGLARVLAERLVHLARCRARRARGRSSSIVSLVTATGTTALVMMGLSSGPADPRQHRHRDQRRPASSAAGRYDGQQPRRRAPERATSAPQDQAADEADLADVLVQAEPLLRVAGGDRLMPQVGLFATPTTSRAARTRSARGRPAPTAAWTADGRATGRRGRARGAVRGGNASVAALRMPAPGAQVLGDDRLPLARLAALRLRRDGRRRRGTGRLCPQWRRHRRARGRRRRAPLTRWLPHFRVRDPAGAASAKCCAPAGGLLV